MLLSEIHQCVQKDMAVTRAVHNVQYVLFYDGSTILMKDSKYLLSCCAWFISAHYYKDKKKAILLKSCIKN